jgi:hypothetical protein
MWLKREVENDLSPVIDKLQEVRCLVDKISSGTVPPCSTVPNDDFSFWIFM